MPVAGIELMNGHFIAKISEPFKGYDAHDYADVRREALETLFRHLENISASVVHMATRVAA